MAMRFGLFKGADGRAEVRSADGRPLPRGDADRRIVHVLPQFFCPEDAIDFIGPGDVTLEVRSAALASRGVEVCPEGGIKIRQPYPNRRFLVAGSEDIRVGWILPVPEDVAELDLEFEWSFAPGTIQPACAFVAHHRMEVRLAAGSGKTYTLDTGCWPRNGGDDVLPIHSKPYTPHSLAALSEYRRSRVSEARSWDEEEVAGLEFVERITLPSQTVADLWSISQFDDEQLHEVTQHRAVEANADLHAGNACVEMPASVFERAVALAREIPFGRGSEFAATGVGAMGHCETHPAVIELCRWWNSNAPVDAARTAGMFNLWVRVRDDGQYWAGHDETPSVPMEMLSDGIDAHARVGGLVLVEFTKGSKDFTFDASGFEVQDVTGRVVGGAGVGRDEIQSGSFDEAWYCVNALRNFPERFPEAWDEVLSAVAEEGQAEGDLPRRPGMRF